MKTSQILSFAFVLFLTNSCKSETQKQKEQQIKTRISEMKTEIDSVKKEETKVVAYPVKEKSTEQIVQKQENQADKIIGVWKIKNNYYTAVYEIEKYQEKYVGKVHYYNDGKTEYTGKNTKDDYFLNDVTYNNGTYNNGKMYMPDGSNYKVVFTLKNNDELEANMTVQGSPYTEIWKRQTTK